MLLLFLLLLVFYRIEIIRNSLAVILKIIIFKNFFIVILDLAQFVALDCVDLLTGCFVLRLRTVIKIIDLQYKVFPNYLIRGLYELTVLLKDPRLIACL